MFLTKPHTGQQRGLSLWRCQSLINITAYPSFRMKSTTQSIGSWKTNSDSSAPIRDWRNASLNATLRLLACLLACLLSCLLACR